jgi:phenylpropionate dioxygenase-like ring-hydroxylating dioxygenase large terminal subunit
MGEQVMEISAGTVKRSGGSANDIAPDVELSHVRAPIGHAHHAPGYIYSAPEMLAREKRAIFLEDWLFVCREEEIKNPCDYLAVRLLDEPVLIVRDAEGTLRAFANLCLHRGVELVSGAGNAKRFSCPYHAWTYGLDGRLLGAPHMDEITEFDPKTCRLKTIRLGVWAGNVMVTFNPKASEVEDFVAKVALTLGFIQLDQCAMAEKTVIDLPCNWKFAVENFMDFYHVGTLHAKTIGRAFTHSADAVELFEGGGIALRYKQGSGTTDGNTRFGRLPWLTEPDEERGLGAMVHVAPHWFIFSGADSVRLLVVWPTGPESSRLTIYFLFPKEWHGDPAFQEKVKAYRDYQVSVIEEDYEMIKSLQAAMKSGNFEPGPMSKLERPIHHTINTILTRVFRGAPPERPAPSMRA